MKPTCGRVEPDRCPSCGPDDAHTILYGLPADDVFYGERIECR